MSSRSGFRWYLVMCGLGLATSQFSGCGRSPEAGSVPPPPTKVQVSQVVEETVTDYVDYIGKTVAVEEVDIRARVTGYLDQVAFRDGDVVEKGQLLYRVDPRPYAAIVNQAKGDVERAQAEIEQAVAQKGVSEAAKTTREAELTLAQENFERISKLAEQSAATSQDLDLRRSQLATAKANIISADSDLQLAAARIDVAKAALASVKAQQESAELNLGFTRLTAPISGRIGKTALTEGNYVQSADVGATASLTSIVSINPIHVDFDADEATVLRIREMVRDGKADKVADGKVKAFFSLVSENGFPHEGVITFFENQVNSNTGTLQVRATFDTGDQEVQPGFYARVRVPVGRARQAILISERAVATDLGQKVVYVVNDKNEVVSRPVTLGQNHDGWQVVEEGLTAGDRIVVNGIQLVSAGVTVEPEVVPMPSTDPKRSAESSMRAESSPGQPTANGSLGTPATDHEPSAMQPTSGDASQQK